MIKLAIIEVANSIEIDEQWFGNDLILYLGCIAGTARLSRLNMYRMTRISNIFFKKLYFFQKNFLFPFMSSVLDNDPQTPSLKI